MPNDDEAHNRTVRLETYDDYRQRVREVLDHIHRNLDTELGVRQLSEVASISPFHFQRIFSRLVGENCIQLVRRIRLERAAWQLQTTDKPISEIAFDAEFQSQEAFARAFRTSFGSPATTFRSAQWITYHLLAPSRFHFTPVGEPIFEPISANGDGVAFELRDHARFSVACRRHEGAPHLLAKSTILLAKDLEHLGFDHDLHPIATFAYGLAPGQPVSGIESYVAAPKEFAREESLRIVELGGGLHLVVPFMGPGSELGDLWFRMWAEAFPASGATLRNEPCFQILRTDRSEPAMLHATLFVPVTL